MRSDKHVVSFTRSFQGSGLFDVSDASNASDAHDDGNTSSKWEDKGWEELGPQDGFQYERGPPTDATKKFNDQQRKPDA